MNGHGGDQFLKFHDMEEVSSHDLGGALREMELKKRYHRVHTLLSFLYYMIDFDGGGEVPLLRGRERCLS